MNNPSIFTPKGVHAKSASLRALERVGIILDITITKPGDLARFARIGLPVTAFERFTQGALTRKEADWIIPARTFTHRKSGDGKLTSEESDKLIRAAKVQALAVEVLGTEEKATLWLHKPRTIFDGLNAVEYMKTEQGAQLVEEALIRMDEGYF
jgi:putative toxin-antitoxin system antitoxin component (TIGR02293 family)